MAGWQSPRALSEESMGTEIRGGEELGEAEPSRKAVDQG